MEDENWFMKLVQFKKYYKKVEKLEKRIYELEIDNSATKAVLNILERALEVRIKK